MTRINKQFFEMAQSSAKVATEIGDKNGGAFDWAIAMLFLRMSYYRADVEEYEHFVKNMESMFNGFNTETGQA